MPPEFLIWTVRQPFVNLKQRAYINAFDPAERGKHETKHHGSRAFIGDWHFRHVTGPARDSVMETTSHSGVHLSTIVCQI